MTALDPHTVLRKTTAGAEAIKSRDRALTPRLRMLLIMVDGAKTVADLQKSVPNPQDADQALTELLNAGFAARVENPAAAQGTAKAAAPGAKPAATASAAGVSLKAAIQKATHLLDDALGPDSVDLCLQIEHCTSVEQFNAKVADIARIVSAMRSPRKGAEFQAAASIAI